MPRGRTEDAPDLFSTPSVGETSAPPTKKVSVAQEQRHVLPQDLPSAVKHLTDNELDLLIAACLQEARRRGRLPTRDQTNKRLRADKSSHPGELEVATVSLKRGQVNAVRAAFKAGVKPSLIARQFGISQSDVRKVLASDAAVGGAR
jgi:homoserine kinase